MRHAIYLALVIITTPALAQEPAPTLELHLGGGFLVADSDLSHQISVDTGAAFWFNRSWGVSLRRGITSIGQYRAPYDYGDGTRTGSRGFRHWTPTLRYRRALDSGLEFNLGVGLVFGTYEHLTWRPGASGRPVGFTYAVGGIATEWLVGRRITPRLGVKGGLIFYPFLDERAAGMPVGFAVWSF